LYFETFSMDKSDLLRLALQTSRAALTAGDHRTAVYQATVAASLADDLQEPEAAADAHCVLMQHLFKLGRFSEALCHGRRALALRQSLRQPERQCEVLSIMAICCVENELLAEGLENARSAFDLSRQHRLPQRLVQALTIMGGLHGWMEDWDHGEALMLHALSRARDQHDTDAVVRAVTNLLAILLAAHDAQTALAHDDAAAATARRLLQHGRHALALCSEQTDGFRRVVMRSNAAAALLVNGMLDDALALLRSCVQQAHAEGFRVVELKARQRLSTCLMAQGEWMAAKAELQAILHDLDVDDHEPARIFCNEQLAELAARDGDEAAAALLRSRMATRMTDRQQARLQLGERLQQNALDVLHALTTVDSEWHDARRQPDVPC
jgi:tetratricopeptide (TPR) repeat protein